MVFSLQANYANWETANCWRISVPTFVDRGVSSDQRGGAPWPLISVFQIDI
jgi:hypothetical protein